MKKPNLHSVQKSKKEESSKTETEILHLITEDHRELRRLFPLLQDIGVEVRLRKSAFDEFAILLRTHMQAKEESLYFVMKRSESFREQALQSEVAHRKGRDLLAEIDGAPDCELWSAKVKALADLVEQHLHEEGFELLPDFAEAADLYERLKLGRMFLKVKESLLDDDFDYDAPVRHQLTH